MGYCVDDDLVNGLCVVCGLQGGRQVMLLLISMIKGMLRMLFMSWMVRFFVYCSLVF